MSDLTFRADEAIRAVDKLEAALDEIGEIIPEAIYEKLGIINDGLSFIENYVKDLS
jgi:hypothetical protein